MATTDYTCSVESCEKKMHSRGWCATHYQRWSQTGDPLRPCKTCGIDVIKLGDRTYCTDECKPECRIEACTRKIQVSRDVCPMHHKTNRMRGGNDPSRTWATVLVCEYCGGPSGLKRGFRKYCSPNCTQFAAVYPNGRPKFATCAGCNKRIDLNELGKGGKRKRVGTKLCLRCKRSIHKHDMTVEMLAARDGVDCTICGESVDLSAVNPDPFRPSIDHYTPRSRGGTNDPDNLKLTHLWCNQVKSDRESFTI